MQKYAMSPAWESWGLTASKMVEKREKVLAEDTSQHSDISESFWPNQINGLWPNILHSAPKCILNFCLKHLCLQSRYTIGFKNKGFRRLQNQRGFIPSPANSLHWLGTKFLPASSVLALAIFHSTSWKATRHNNRLKTLRSSAARKLLFS